MKIIITGSSGLIGRALVPRLVKTGCTVGRLVRGEPKAGEIGWKPEQGLIDRAALEGADVVIHLAGEPLAEGRWTAAKKRRIVESRTGSTRLLAEALAGLAHKPKSFLSASAIGYYGSRGEEILDESSLPGSGFLARVCEDWEHAARAAAEAGIRTVNLRIGVVLDKEGGALKQMLPAFRLGLGGPLGSGRQFLSWISLEDVLGAIEHIIARSEMVGPVNLTAPTPVTNAEFTRALAAAVHRPAFLRIPPPLLRLAVGEMADEAILASARVLPTRLLASGFRFSHPSIGPTLDELLGRKN